MLQAHFHRAGKALPVAALLVALGLVVFGGGQALTREGAQTLLSTSRTVLDQPIAYPTQAPANVTSVIVTMQPGEETGWHKHDVPMFGYILEGEVTVDYEGYGTRVYRKGDAVMEAIGTAHNGRSTGKVPARIMAVFMGADGVPNTEMMKAPQ